MGLDKGRLAVADLRRSGSDMLLYLSSSSSGDGVRPQQPLHSLIALHGWQLDGLMQQQQQQGGGGDAGSKWQQGRPEAVVACTGGLLTGVETSCGYAITAECVLAVLPMALQKSQA
jgi:hypothetical protein